MRKIKLTSALVCCSVVLMSGCAATGDQYRANVYSANQVNTAQAARVVTIISVTPAQVSVDNSEAKQKAQLVGGVLGAIAGGLGGNLASRNNGTATAGGVLAGAALGSAAGALAPSHVLVDGVSLAFRDEAGQLRTSTQVGRSCEFKTGTALMVSTAANETRIQPNDSRCKE